MDSRDLRRLLRRPEVAEQVVRTLTKAKTGQNKAVKISTEPNLKSLRAARLYRVGNELDLRSEGRS